jgi:hypothetical protein
MTDGQTFDNFYAGTDPGHTGPRKTLAQWKKEFNGGVEAKPGEILLTEEQAHGALQRENLVRRAKALAEIIKGTRKLFKPRQPKPKTLEIEKETPSSIRVRP